MEFCASASPFVTHILEALGLVFISVLSNHVWLLTGGAVTLSAVVPSNHCRPSPSMLRNLLPYRAEHLYDIRALVTESIAANICLSGKVLLGFAWAITLICKSAWGVITIHIDIRFSVGVLGRARSVHHLAPCGGSQCLERDRQGVPLVREPLDTVFLSPLADSGQGAGGTFPQSSAPKGCFRSLGAQQGAVTIR